ncbi:serine/threonine-protein kinase Chk2-like [Venturia canescens]|uniref:serine/threonine-protein kinase Chk2-like n=1 Tax=Venturia canescens TaxID=32260 RepID=UPI001C9C3DBD|nr:serine/threonine-protein kinase Chk2-like [Venturia canescens]
MATVDEEIPLTLPDTQNVADALLTQSQEITPPSQVIWGRLFPNSGRFKHLVMSKDVYTIGRHTSCDVRPIDGEWTDIELSVISKFHLRITREVSPLSAQDVIVYLEDLSFNGTFVNGNKVGKGNKVILRHNDVIALAKQNIEVYTYLRSSNPESDCLPQELKSKYIVSRTLGSGACGEVKLILDVYTGARFALKTISKKTLTRGHETDMVLEADRIRTEVNILRSLRHPCIMKMEKIVDTPTKMFIVLEMMEGGELFDRITASDGLPEDVTKLIFFQIVLAVNYLHKQGITHRDLKPENILLASNAEYPLVKVTDFGLSKFVDEETMMRTFCGTPMYVAPEMLLTNGRGTYTNQVDVWSLGVILYVCLTGRTPFTIRNATIPLRDQIIKGMYRCTPSIFEGVTSRAIDLVKRMMTTDPIKRIQIGQIRMHPWLKDYKMRAKVNALISSYEQENNATEESQRYNQPENFDEPALPLAKRLRRR